MKPPSGDPASAGDAATPASAIHKIDLEYLGEHGHLKIQDAQNIHSVMMRQHGITEPDEVVADWNRRDPDAPWGSGKAGKYIRELTDLVCAFMSEKIEQARAERVNVQAPPIDATD